MHKHLVCRAHLISLCAELIPARAATLYSMGWFGLLCYWHVWSTQWADLARGEYAGPSTAEQTGIKAAATDSSLQQ
jgi:hypothetical protein